MGDQLVLLCGAICGVVFGIGFFRGYGYVQMLRLAITLAASAVPEGLPAAATINFALSITNMRKHGVAGAASAGHRDAGCRPDGLPG